MGGAIGHDRRSKASGRASVPPSSASEFGGIVGSGGGHLHHDRGHGGGGGHLHHGGGSHHQLNGHHSGSRGMLANSEDLHAWSIYRQNLNSDFTDSALGSTDKSPLPYGN